ncbi:MAG: hypothetical protein ACTSWP_02980 [Candidatus Freyarchaeota archaeon]|nr:hypothetical protein [Candidatus Freyrarchaeum guaymaensis]HDO81270.1 hypothetical protein [Candidatus Bathyarchaeota archaeon]
MVPDGLQAERVNVQGLLSPKDKFADKKLKDVSLRGWNFEEAGAFRERGGRPSREELVEEWMGVSLEVLEKALTLRLSPGSLPRRKGITLMKRTLSPRRRRTYFLGLLKRGLKRYLKEPP